MHTDAEHDRKIPEVDLLSPLQLVGGTVAAAQGLGVDLVDVSTGGNLPGASCCASRTGR